MPLVRWPERGRPVPAPGWGRRLEALARLSVPALSTALLMVLATVPMGLPSPVFALALPAIVFWTVFRPAAMLPPVVFALGLLLELLTAAPLGSAILVLLLLQGVMLRLRRVLARQSFLTVWCVFAVAAQAAALLHWALQMLLILTLLPVAPALHGALFACGLYPLMAFLLTRAHEAMLRAENAP